MRTATGLALIALGAILAFAVKGHPSWLDIQVVGWVLLLTGIAGMFIPRRGYGWLRRRMVLRRGPRGPVVSRVDETHYPPYVLSPGPSGSGSSSEGYGTGVPAADGPATVADPPTYGIMATDQADEDAGRQAAEREASIERAEAQWEAADRAAAPGEPRPAEEVIEEYVEE